MNLRTVLDRAWRSGFSTKSDFARTNANEVAVAASQGLITTHLKGNTFGTTWLITREGLSVLNECY